MRLSRKYRFEAAHFLPFVAADHKCGRLHGHTYTVEIEIYGEVNFNTGMLIDFAEIDRVWEPIGKQLDHHLLNDLLINPTSELLAMWIWDKLHSELSISAVKVSENEQSSCTYKGGAQRADN